MAIALYPVRLNSKTLRRRFLLILNLKSDTEAPFFKLLYTILYVLLFFHCKAVLEGFYQ